MQALKVDEYAKCEDRQLYSNSSSLEALNEKKLMLPATVLVPFPCAYPSLRSMRRCVLALVVVSIKQFLMRNGLFFRFYVV